MKRSLVLVLGLHLLAGTCWAKEGRDIKIIEDGGSPYGDIMAPALFGVAQAGTTWLGNAQNPGCPWYDIGPGVWDFDCGGTMFPCPPSDGQSAYLKDHHPQGGLQRMPEAMGWTSEDVYAQKDLYWHAEDFTDPGLACSDNPIAGTYSAWCGRVAADPGECLVAAPGYGHDWSQWSIKTVTLDATTPRLKYKFNSDTQAGSDYCYVLIDSEFPDSCGWVGDLADTLRCYDGPHGTTTEDIDLSNVCADPGLCDDVTTCSYSGDSVKICFVVVSDGAWDDEDGRYDTCHGAITLDDIFIDTAPSSGDSVVTDFETGTLEAWITCGGWSAGDWTAIRHREDFINNDPCGFANCDIENCVLVFWNPNIPGQYGNGGHHARNFHNRAWSPAVDMTAIPPRGYVMRYDRYADLPIANWMFYRHWARYVQNPRCPAGAWSPPVSDNYAYYAPTPSCEQRLWGFSDLVPTTAESVKIGLSAWNGCNVWNVPCTNGNESPCFDNIQLGYWDLSAPQASLRAVDNYTDSFPEADSMIVPAHMTPSEPVCAGTAAGNTALIDCASNKSQRGYFMRLADSLVISLATPDVYAELCFRIRPGPCTDLMDPWWGRMDLTAVMPCSTTDVGDQGRYTCVRMDTAFAAGDGDTASTYEYQVVFEDYYASMIHEDDARYMGEGEEIFPDSLFTPGTQIYYAIRTSFLPGPGPYAWLPPGADMDDLSTLYEVEVLPNRCRLEEEMACLLYVDYFNRGAQAPIEEALTSLGRTWDRFDLRAETSHQGNGIGNRKLGTDLKRLARGPIGPSNEHLSQYAVMLINNGNFPSGVSFSDGGTGTPDDPSNDIGFLDDWLHSVRGVPYEGMQWKGLWLSGNNIATDFATATAGPKPGFLDKGMGTELVASSYRDWTGHPLEQNCLDLHSNKGLAKSENYFDDGSETMYRLVGSGCPQRHGYDVITTSYPSGVGDVCGHALCYDNTHIDFPPGAYASVYHVLVPEIVYADSVRTLLDGFSLHYLRDYQPNCDGALSIALWTRKILGGNRYTEYGPGGTPNPPYWCDWNPKPDDPSQTQQRWAERGYMYDRKECFQYCPPSHADSVTGIGDRPIGTYANALFQNYPNPFRSASGTTIHYSVAKAGVVEVRIFDVAGRLLNTIVDQAKPGENFVIWNGVASDGRSVASGVYFYQVKTDGFKAQKKMMLVK